jgi:sulfate adenylyltransferase subunit 1
VDLVSESGVLEFELSTGFQDYLGKGNRVLFRLRDLSQVVAVAQLAYDHTLSFEFDRIADGISVLLFKRSISRNDGVTTDDGTGI